jgi:dihydrofolate reductase
VNDTPPPAATPSAAADLRALGRIAVIAAVARNGVIGVDNRLPWRIPDDLKRFRALTMGHSIIMGRRTWESLSGPLPGRQNIVVTRQSDFRAAGAQTASSLQHALELATLPQPVFVIGGEALYRAALPLADTLYLTEIDRDFPGDARFPAFEHGEWRETSRESRHGNGPDRLDYAFAVYVRSGERA